MEPPRSLQRRKQDTLGRLESDADARSRSAPAETSPRQPSLAAFCPQSAPEMIF